MYVSCQISGVASCLSREILCQRASSNGSKSSQEDQPLSSQINGVRCKQEAESAHFILARFISLAGRLTIHSSRNLDVHSHIDPREGVEATF
jgi:hypothetical protein